MWWAGGGKGGSGAKTGRGKSYAKMLAKSAKGRGK
jgi:hypothetical protein